jgi:GAF domain-containing protein
MAGLAKIPTRLDDQIIVAFNLYSAEPRQWSDEAIAVARVVANLATSYVLNASKLRQQEQLSEKLQKALDSRLTIEQAKRITAYQRAVTVDQACLRIRRHAITTPTCGSSRGDRQRGASGLSSAAVAVVDL